MSLQCVQNPVAVDGRKMNGWFTKLGGFNEGIGRILRKSARRVTNSEQLHEIHSRDANAKAAPIMGQSTHITSKNAAMSLFGKRNRHP